MPIPHIYESVVEVSWDNLPEDLLEGVTQIKLEDGTLVHLPPAAYDEAKKIQKRDRMLIDLSGWLRKDAAMVAVYREGYDDLVAGFLVEMACVMQAQKTRA